MWTKRYQAIVTAKRQREEIEPRFAAMERAAEVAINDMFPTYSWGAGYYDTDGNIYCSYCAKLEYIEQGTKFKDDIYEEGPDDQCCSCGAAISSVYGDPTLEMGG